MKRISIASVFGFVIAIIPFLGFSGGVTTTLVVIFGLAVPFVLLLPRQTLSSFGKNNSLENLENKNVEETVE